MPTRPPAAPAAPRDRATATRTAGGRAPQPRPRRGAAWPHLLLGLLALAVYTLTLAPGLLPADAGEYQLVGAVLGVAHPPGFALYTLASWLISRWPGAAPAAAINFLSALLAAGTLALLSRGSARLWGSPLAGLAGAAALGLSTTFWAQATTANIRMPAAFATAWAFERLTAYHAQTTGGQPRSGRTLAWLALALGLGVSHHASLVFIAAVLGGYALWLRPGVLRRPWPLLAGALPFAAWLYLPLRAGAFNAPPGIATLPGLLEHILALGFRGDLFFFAQPGALPARLAVFANILRFEFVMPQLALMGLGAAAAIWRARSLGWVLLLAAAVHSFVAITYRAPQTVEYLMPAYVLLGAWAAGGLAVLGGAGLRPGAPRQARLVLPLAAALAAAWTLSAQWQATAPSYWRLAREDGTRGYAERVLGEAPPNALVLASWHWATPLWYLQHVEGRRPDVEVVYVFPRGEALAQTWVAAIDDALPERPVVVTSFFAAEYASRPYRFVPLGPAWEVRADPITTAPPGLSGARPAPMLDFLGYRVDAIGAEAVSVVAAWQRTAETPADLGLFVHLLNPDGTLHSQQDVTRAGASEAPGEVLLDRYSLPIAPDAPPGTYHLVAGAYQPGEPGTRLADIALTEVVVTRPASTVAVPAGAVPLGSALWVAGAAITPPGPVRAGEAVTVRLELVAARPLTSDYTISAGLIGPGYAWQVRSDGTPAGGAIPTLKWIAGSRVTDTHTLVVPAEAAPGTATLTVVVYDAFTQQPLPVLDAARAAEGALVIGTIEVLGR